MDSFIESSNVTSDAPSPPPYHEMDLDAFNLHCTKYVLVGVVVHTGTSEGGHYYAILQERDQTSLPMSKWFMFNDQQVTEFDPDNIGQVIENIHGMFSGTLILSLNIRSVMAETFRMQDWTSTPVGYSQACWSAVTVRTCCSIRGKTSALTRRSPQATPSRQLAPSS